jgi:hypothetical protein
MHDRNAQRVALLALAVALSLFLAAHALVVEVDFDACFGNYAASINGARPYRMVGDMSVGEVIAAAIARISTGTLLVAGLSLFSLLPFIVAWSLSRSPSARAMWLVAAAIGFGVIVVGTATSDLTGFYECDRNGIGLGALIGPFLYALIDLAVIAVLGFGMLIVAHLNRA